MVKNEEGQGVGWVRAPTTKGFWNYGRKLVVAVVGTTVVLIGVAMLVLPGPATLVIPFGIAILGIEFAWARQLRQRVRSEAMRINAQARARKRHKQRSVRP
jgi:putative transmembrane protein PGPGW